MRFDKPILTFDKGDYDREWVHLKPPNFYVHQDEKTKEWFVIDRSTDYAVTKFYKSKMAAVRAFIRSNKEREE